MGKRKQPKTVDRCTRRQIGDLSRRAAELYGAATLRLPSAPWCKLPLDQKFAWMNAVAIHDAGGAR